MDKEAKEIKRILVLSFWFVFAVFTAIRMSALFRCAWQLKGQEQPLDVLGHSYGVLTPLLGFPLSLLQVPTSHADANLPLLLCCGIVLNSLMLGLAAASFMVGGLALWAKFRCDSGDRISDNGIV